MVTQKSAPFLLLISLLLGIAGLSHGMAPHPESRQSPATVEVAADKVLEAADPCQVKPLFLDAGRGGSFPAETIQTVTLVRYERKPQDEGVVMKRWAGDTSGDTKTVEIERRAIKLSDVPNGLIPLAPGLYQFKYSSVSGRPPSGYYGESRFFEIKPGQKTLEINILLYAAI